MCIQQISRKFFVEVLISNYFLRCSRCFTDNSGSIEKFHLGIFPRMVKIFHLGIFPRSSGSIEMDFEIFPPLVSLKLKRNPTTC